MAFPEPSDSPRRAEPPDSPRRAEPPRSRVPQTGGRGGRGRNSRARPPRKPPNRRAPAAEGPADGLLFPLGELPRGAAAAEVGARQRRGSTDRIERLVDEWRRDPRWRGRLVHLEILPPRPARFAEPAAPLPCPLREALRRAGIARLYVHQARAVDLARAGRDFVVVTATASGKTMCYNLPVLERLLAEPRSRALYLFPTKALAQDQLKTLRTWAEAHPAIAGVLRPATYDGDTPRHRRPRLRAEASVILSNPDMLHVGILPNHPRWAEFLRHLAFVVVDEMHQYRGIFGSNVAMVLRRLRRLCAHYGSRPLFIGTSATIANPSGLAEALTGRPVACIDEDGSPQGLRLFALWNPPPLDEAGLARRSANIEATDLLVRLVEEGLQTIVFTKARVVAELIYRYARQRLAARRPDLAERLRAYRGGYLPEDRRRIEQALFRGDLLAVASTNALELGIDVGSLEAAVLVGFPGTIASMWQQAGRAGRRSESALAILVAYDDPVDQYLVRHPDYLLGRPVEEAVVDPRNPYILQNHLACAAAELPLVLGRGSGAAPGDPRLPDGASPDESREGAPEPATGGAEPVGEWAAGACPVEAAGAGARDGEPQSEAATAPPVDDLHLFGAEAVEVARAMTEDGRLVGIDGRLFWARPESPSRRTSLRTISEDTFAIVRTDGGRETLLGRVDATSAPELVYPGAVYLHEGESYLVRHLDLAGRVAYVEAAETDYYTQPVLSAACTVEAEERRRRLASAEVAFGRLAVTWATVGFKKIRYYTGEAVGYGALDLPSQTLQTRGLWLVPEERVLEAVRAEGHGPGESLAALRNLMLVCLPMLAMCDRRDVSGLLDAANTGRPTVFLYDRFLGGLGFAERGFEAIGRLLRLCRDLVVGCPCAEGCPGCVGPANLRPPLHQDPDLGSGPAVPSKRGAEALLERLLEGKAAAP